MSDNSGRRQQGGPGPPYAQQMMPSFMHEASVSRQHGQTPSSAPTTLASGHHQGMGPTQAERNVGASATMTQGLRMGQPSMGFVPASFQAICGGVNARGPIGASAYYPYPSVTSMYPYSVVGQGSSSASTTLDPDRVSAVNRAAALSRAAAPVAPASAIEAAWGAQYSHAAAWGAVSGQSSRRAPSFASIAATTSGVPGPSTQETTATSSSVSSTSSATPATASATPTVGLPAYIKPATVPIASKVAAENKNNSGAGARVMGTTEVIDVAASSDGNDARSGGLDAASQVTAAQSSGEGTTTQTTTESDEINQRLQQSLPVKRGAGAESESDIAGGAAGEHDAQVDFETDGTGKRRRLTAEERLQRSRERNQLHARKTRQRKKVQLQLLMNRSAHLQAEQQRLRQAITDRRTASILLGMSGSEDAHADGQASKASRDHPAALAGMSSRTPRAGMLAALECDDATEGSMKGVGGNGSDDLGSESTAGTSGSVSSSGRTSSEANSSDGMLGVADGEVTDKPKVGNPGDTERLLELSQKTRSECTPEELEEIRRERNRMHAKRTRDRKKLHLEATEGMIARLEQENRKLRESMKAMSSGLGIDPVPPATPARSSASPAPDVHLPGYQQTGQPIPSSSSSQHAGSAQAHAVATHSSQPSAQQYSGHHPFLHHATHMQHLHGHPHAHLYAAQHHLPHGAHPLMHSAMQPSPHTHISYYPHGFEPSARGTGVDNGGGGSNGGRAGGAGGNGAGNGSAGGGGTGANTGIDSSSTGLVKPEMTSYPPGTRMGSMGYLGHSNPHYAPHPQVLAYHGSSAFVPLGGKSHLISATPHGPHPYTMPEPRNYKGWESHGHAAPGSSYPGGWAGGSYGADAGGGSMPTPTPMQQQEIPAKSSSSIQKAQRCPDVGGEHESDRLGTSVSRGRHWGQSSPQTAISNDDDDCGAEDESGTNAGINGTRCIDAMDCSAGSTMVDGSSLPCNDGGSEGGGDGAGGSSRSTSGGNGTKGKNGKISKGTSSSSPSSSPAGNGPARHLARVRVDQARAEKARAASAAEEDANHHMLDRDLSRGCQEAWHKVRRHRSAKRKRDHTSSSGSGSSHSNGHGHESSSPSLSRASGTSLDSGSERDGSGGDCSESSSSSSSSWLGGSESSILPASTTSSEEGRGRESMTRSGSESSRDSPSMSESGSDEMGSGGDYNTGNRSGDRVGRGAISNKHERRSSVLATIVQRAPP